MKPYFSFLIFIFMAVTLHSQTIKLKQIVSGLNKPVDIASSGLSGDERLFVVEKDGRIKIVKNGSLVGTFLDIDPLVNSAANERGLLGLVFHPNYDQNGYFFIHYNNTQGHTTIARYRVDSLDKNKANPGSAKIILTVNQPYNNHNGGDLNFGKDGYLYIALGDGGNGGDPGNRSQNTKELLGKVLRIDVDTENAPYLIPADNPFRAAGGDTLKEIWSIGWRNPWRFSFDRDNGDMWLADVGQDAWEEIDREVMGKSGLNYGWRCYEGDADFKTGGCQSKSNYAPPVHVYPNRFDVGCSVTGGYVYRGQSMPEFYGDYLYADFCTGKFWSLSEVAGAYENTEIGDFENEDISSFGEDENGELYVAGLASGKIYKLEPISSHVSQNEIPKKVYISNPIAQDKLRFDVSDDFISGEFSIINAYGNQIVSGMVDANHMAIDLKSISPGVYILYVGKGRAHVSRKFVKPSK
jgi:glucose/arabinose dehydrogenase